MGFTHYFYRKPELDAVKFSAAVVDARRILDAVRARGIRLAGPMGKGELVLSDAEIAFNGRAPKEDHETFGIDRTWTEPYPGHGQSDEGGRMFDFCKTAHKPYDLAVTAVLLVLQHHLGADIRLSSDGVSAEWEPAERLVREVCGYEERFRVEDEEAE